ncbi:RE1-silencing transcription factor-like [Battus philenor]|uniref:RE1-silencing transcription factor-like n=1 Tax=Battus philenor TaxID=42288 RepID=UPI0035CFB273
MVMSCCVEGCDAKDVVYFRFPNSKTRCKKWLENIKVNGKLTYNSMVCSAHFHPDDYGIVRGKVRLKPKVLPVSQNETSQKSNQNSQNPSNNHKKTDNIETDNSRVEINQNHNGNSKENGDENSEMEMESNHIDKDHRQEADAGEVPNKLSESTNEIKQGQQTGSAIEKDDIEDILTYYYIKQNKEVAERQTEELQKEKLSEEVIKNGDKTADDSSNVIDLSNHTEPQPVFIEVAVDQEHQATAGPGSPRDCLMLLESVQVELDPNDLLLPDRDEDTGHHEEPISLLTSSDEDDVIIQEPHIETVEVSDATDEDDVPLVSLLSPGRSPRELRPRKRAPNPFYRKNGFGIYEYYCLQCSYRTTEKVEYQKHMLSHSTVILACPKCEYTTSSKTQYTRHKKRHQEERRFQCHLCQYRARHRMSLVYHLKCHESVGDKCHNVSDKCHKSVSEICHEIVSENCHESVNESCHNSVNDICSDFKCDKCGYKAKHKRHITRHVRHCNDKVYSCRLCDYITKRKSDLKRHKMRKHQK